MSDADPRLVLTRLTFGPRPGQWGEVAASGSTTFVEDQLARTVPDPDVERMLTDFRILGLATRKEMVDAVHATSGRYSDRWALVQRELVHSNVVRAVYSEHQLYEMMCHLWMDHFNVMLVDVGHVPLHLSYQEFVIRRHAMGRFSDLLKATAHAPAMLQYLDNASSNANSDQGVNENYGRELLELHSLGIHNDDSQVYTEADVQAASRAMSGWTLNYRTDSPTRFEFAFNPNAHADTDVSLLNGAWTSQGLEGKAVGDSLLDFLAGHESTARYVAAKLVRRFVDDGDRSRLIESAAQVYLENDTELVPVLRHIFNSRQFARSDGNKVRRPFEVMVAMLRASDAVVTVDPHSDEAATLRAMLDELGHLPWHWPTPDGYPEEGVSWLTTAGLVGRWNLAGRLARGEAGFTVDSGRYRLPVGPVIQAIEALAADFALPALSDEQKAALVAATGLRPGQPAADLTDDALIRIAGLLFAHSTFQLR